MLQNQIEKRFSGSSRSATEAKSDTATLSASPPRSILRSQEPSVSPPLPGKTESWLMLSFRDNVSMYFKGDDAPCVICQVKLFGSAAEEAYQNLTEALTDIIHEELDVEADRIYVTYEEIGVWGWNGGNL